MKALLVLTFFLFFAFEVHADIYKQISEDGAVLFSNSASGGGCKVVVREKKKPPQKITKEQEPVSYNRDTFDAAVNEKCRQHDIDPQLVRAVIRAESNWNPDAVSPKGALGLMQLMPATAAILGVNPFDPFENIDGGVRYLKHLIGRFNGNLTLALAAYNAGPKLVEKKGRVPSIRETVMYVKRVLDYYNNSQGIKGRIAFNASPQEIQTEIKKEYNMIKKVVMEDGTLLFTNSYFAGTY